MAEFIQNLCNWKNSLSPTDCVTILIALLTLVATIYIPKRIMQEQTYSSLMSDYRSYDFAVAIQGIIEFFTVECAGDIEKVGSKFKEQFFRDMYDIKGDDVEKIKSIEDLRKQKIEKFAQTEPSLCLHYQRRLLSQFFYQLDLCTRYSRSYKKRIQRDFTKNEAKIIRILLAINEAVEGDAILFKELDCDFHVRPDKYVKGMNHWLSHLYHILDKSKPRMQC